MKKYPLVASWLNVIRQRSLHEGYVSSVALVRGLAIAATVCALAGCTSTTFEPKPSDAATTTVVEAAPSPDSYIYSEVLCQLILLNHSWGIGMSPIQYVYILDRPRTSNSQVAAPFDQTLQAHIMEQSVALPPVQFIAAWEDKAAPARIGLTGVENDGVIVSLAIPEHQSDSSVHVRAGFWCGIDCGIEMTYVLSDKSGDWRIIATTNFSIS